MKKFSALSALTAFPALFGMGLLGFLALWLGSCQTADTDGDQYLTWQLNPALSDYDIVVIDLVDSGDSSKVLEHVWDKKLPDPADFPKYKLTTAKGKDFTIRIRAYNANHELVLAKDIPVVGKTSKPTVVLQADLRLHQLKVSQGSLKPAFDPNVPGYTLELPDTSGEVRFTVVAMDSANKLSLNGDPLSWGILPPQTLGHGDNLFTFKVTNGGEAAGSAYQLVVTRGAPKDIDTTLPVDKLEISPRSLKLYKGDSPKALTLALIPAATPYQWISRKPGIVTVDHFGNAAALDSGTATLVARAGNKIDSIPVEAVVDAPKVGVGANVSVRKGGTVVFPISIHQEHGTIVAFKYDLDGDGAWDNADSAHVPDSLVHTYTELKNHTATFYIRDSEGNEVSATRTIHVTDDGLLVTIVWPGRDTSVNVHAITVRYTVGEGGAELTRDFILKAGSNLLKVEAVDGTAKGSDSVTVFLDTTAPIVKILSPKAGAVISGNTVAVSWTVDGVAQTAKTTEDLGTVDGDKAIVRQFQDSAGNIGSDTVHVIRDVTPPKAPNIRGSSPTNVLPKWTWNSNGGGSGNYRVQKGSAIFPSGAPETTDTSYVLTDVAVSGTKYTLYVEERDGAGNWSAPASLEILYDSARTVVNISTPQSSGTYVTRNASVSLTGTTSGHYGVTQMTLKVNNAATGTVTFKNGAWSISNIAIPEGAPTILTVGFTDSSGGSGEAALTVLRATTAPSVPVLTASPPTPTQAGKGSWSWTVGNDGASGSGLNGKYRYALNGAAFTETAATTIQDLILNEGNNTFAVQEQDNAGNWSASATGKTLVDRVGPGILITSHTSPASLTSSHVTVSGTVSDSGSGLLSVTVAGQVSGSGNAVITGGTWTTGDLVLKSGANTLIFTATDKVGNATNASLAANVNVAIPQVTITYPPAGTFTNKDTITVKYKVDGGVETSKAFTGLVDGANPLTVTSPPNDLGQTGSALVTVTKETTAPNAPTLSTIRPATHLDPKWTWTSNGDNAGGSGIPATPVYQVIVDGGTPITVNTASYTLTGAAEKSYSVVVREQDKAGNWSANSNALAVTVDKTAPVVTIDSPADGFITNYDGVPVTYTESGSLSPGFKNKNFASLIDNGAVNTLTVTSDSDAAGNIATASIKAYYRSNVVFVNAAATGLNNGSSWIQAYTSIQLALAGSSAKQIWVAKGTYTSDSVGYGLTSNDSLYGGFDAATAHALTDRVPFNAATKTTLRNPKSSLLYLVGAAANPLHDIVLDGFDIPNEFNYGTTFQFTWVVGFSIVNCNMTGGTAASTSYYAINASSSIFTCTGVKFADFVTGSGYAIMAYGPGSTGAGQPFSATFKDCEFTDDKVGFADHLMDMNVNALSITNSKFTGPLRNGNLHVWSENASGIVTVTGSTFKSASQAASIKTAGTNNTISGNTFTP